MNQVSNPQATLEAMYDKMVTQQVSKMQQFEEDADEKKAYKKVAHLFYVLSHWFSKHGVWIQQSMDKARTKASSSRKKKNVTVAQVEMSMGLRPIESSDEEDRSTCAHQKCIFNLYLV